MRIARPLLVLCAGSLALLLSAPEALAQPHSAEHRLVAHFESSGPLDNPGRAPATLFATLIEAPGAEWLRLEFGRVELGVGSHLRLTAIEDGATQHLGPIQIQQWRSTSAYFNGSAVLVELIGGPGSRGNLVEVGDLMAGIVPTRPLTICGPTDDRVFSDEPERARLLNVGCTAWMYNEESCFASAGHCVANASRVNVAQFNVPLSNPNGSLNHPPPEDQYAADTSNIPFTNGGVGNDWGLFKVFPNSETGLLPFAAQGAFLELASSLPAAGETVNVVGYGVDGGEANQTQQISFGPVTLSSSNTMRYRADTTGGNSGSGVVDDLTGDAIAIHTHGGCTSTGGSNAGTSITHSGLQAALATFCPAGGGGGVSCEDLHNFVAFCRGSGAQQFILTGVLLNDDSHDGETVTLDVNGTEYVVTVVGDRARLEILGVTPGQYTVTLLDPEGCVPPKTTTCP